MHPLRAFKANLNILLLVCLGLIILTFLAYAPVLGGQFIAYDDQQYVTENPYVISGITAAGFKWAFGFHASNWHPLTWLSHMLDCQLYGQRAWAHHLSNVVIHSANVVLVFLLFLRSTGFMARSAFLAALFAWHPAHVESVAWVAERKDLLCTFFWLLALHAYVGYARRRQIRDYLACLGLFILGAMSKPMIVTLPFVLLLMDFWPLNRSKFAPPSNPVPSISSVRLLMEKIPFFVVTAGLCYLTVIAQGKGYSIVSTAGLALFQRITHAFAAYQHYLAQAFFPHDLSIYYRYHTNLSAGGEVVAILLVIAISIGVILVARRYPFFLAGWGWFLGTLFPVIGLVQVGDQAWADRYTYFPFIGLFAALIWGACELWPRRRSLLAFALATAGCFLFLTFRQSGYWRNSQVLFEHAFKIDPANHMAIAVLGSLDARQGNLPAAKDKFLQSLALRPGYPEAIFFLANTFETAGQWTQAIAEYKKILWYKPILAQTEFHLALCLANAGSSDEAIKHYRAALSFNPDFSLAHNNLAVLLQSHGDFANAISHYSAALKLNPDLPQAHNNLGILFLQNGRLDEGIAHLRQALRLNPENRETLINLAMALNQRENWPEAEALFAKIVPSGISDPNILFQYGKSLAHQGKSRAAASQFASALLGQQDFPPALDALSWILSTSKDSQLRNGTEAVKMAERAVELTRHQDPNKIKTLAAAYAENNRFDDAVKTAVSAAELAAKLQQTNLVAELIAMHADFSQSKPWRE